ncbi:MAG TPA: hypothetical protein VLA43_15175 [Longimicrobiales bacterium]|nr:hypothetical protein [Longimicrobiales bacterium]
MPSPLHRHPMLRGCVPLATLLFLGACSSDSGTGPGTSTPTTGSLTVTTVTSGTDPDPSYDIVVDGTVRGTIGGSASVTITGVTPGSRTVGLAGIRENCGATGDGAQRTVPVTAGGTATAAFTLSCQPYVGALALAVTTTGVELDPDGYEVRVGGGSATAVGTNETVTLQGVPAGSVNVTLSGVAVTCDPTTGNRSRTGTVTVAGTVPYGGTLDLDLALVCTSKDILFIRIENDVHQLYRMNADGTGAVQITSGTGEWFWDPRWSPDGTKITYASDAAGAPNQEIYVMNADGTGGTLICCGTEGLSEGAIFDETPTWSPDGTKIAWKVTRPDEALRGIWVMNADGTGRTQITSEDDSEPDWGPDGRIVFARWQAGSAPTTNLYIMDADGGNLTLLAEGGELRSPKWSPDGSTVAYYRYESASNRYAVWTVPAAGGTPTERVGEAREYKPAWSPDGNDLVFWYWTGPNPTDAHGICTAPVAGGTCDRLSSWTSQAVFDIDPDWR